MTATAAPTDTQSDPREVPGGGRAHPVKHIVRIVVVPAGRSPDQHEHLTREQLVAAGTALKKMPVPGSKGSPATTMFDALKPTDIVVVGKEVASIRLIDDSGKPVLSPPPADQPQPARQLWEHNPVNTDTVLRVWTDSDTIEYRCDRQFEIVRVERTGWKIHGAPEDPFGAGRHIAAPSTADAGLFVWTSGRLPVSANNQQYKATFKIGDQLIDPDYVCGDPPPHP